MTSTVDFSLNRLFLRSTADRPPLRIGVLIDGDEVRAYARRILEDIAASDFARVECYISNDAAFPQDSADTMRTARPLRLMRRFMDRDWTRHLTYTLYERSFVPRGSPSPDPLAPTSCADLMAATRVLRVRPQQKGFVDRLSAEDVNVIRNLALDVILRFGFRIIRGEILTVPKHGVWSFHHGDSTQYRGGPPHFWELVERNPVSGVVLQRLTEELDAGFVLARGLFATVPSLSVADNRFGPYWSSQHFVIRCLHELHSAGAVLRSGPEAKPPPYRGRRRIYTRPTNGEFARWFLPETARRTGGFIARRFRHRLEKSSQPQWKVAVRPATNPLYERDVDDPLWGFRWHENPEGRFWADPFLVDHGSETWLFFEDYSDKDGKGVIACARVASDGGLSDARVVLQDRHHLSYPHVFEHDGTMFMVPESQAAGSVDLYRAERFPDVWKKECSLLDVRAVDSTLFEHDNEWWMLSSPRVVPGHAALTYVWRAPSLFGPWRLASHTPLNADVRTARGAGRVFLKDGQLWRPCQDCSIHYGRALAFNAIDSLEAHPTERGVRVIQAASVPRLVGIHTYNRSARWETIDGFFSS